MKNLKEKLEILSVQFCLGAFTLLFWVLVLKGLSFIFPNILPVAFWIVEGAVLFTYIMLTIKCFNDIDYKN